MGGGFLKNKMSNTLFSSLIFNPVIFGSSPMPAQEAASETNMCIDIIEPYYTDVERISLRLEPLEKPLRFLKQVTDYGVSQIEETNAQTWLISKLY